MLQSPVMNDNVEDILELLQNITTIINSTEDQTVESLLVITDTIKKIGDCSVSL